jgi:hypothetical protein
VSIVSVLVCPRCGNSFERLTSQIRFAEKRRSQTVHYCSPQCAKRPRMSIEGICNHCNTAFSRPRKGGAKDLGKFCSSSCSASFNNPRRPSRARKKPACDDCGGPKSWAGQVCRQCRSLKLNSRTLADLRAEYSTAQFHAKVRGLARAAYTGPRRCAACGYDLHVDVCHIRDVRDFPPTATLAEVNALTNLIALDKRCHWEFDHGHLMFGGGRFIPVMQ